MTRRKIPGITGLLSIIVLLTLALKHPSVRAETDLEIHGFIAGNLAGRTTGQRPGGNTGGDFIISEERLRIDMAAWADRIEVSAQARVDFLHDNVNGEFDLDLREAYIDYTAGKLDIRAGRQIATWGVGDLLFINDVFPKDWVSFFAGRPLEYLKTGVDGIRLRYSSRLINGDILIMPSFTSDNIPDTSRFFMYDPFSTISNRVEIKPRNTFGNTELAGRLYRSIKNYDVSIYGSRGFWKTPSMEPDSMTNPVQVTLFYPRLNVYGISLQGPFLKGVLSLEAGYYDSENDKDGNDPFIPNSQVRFLAGYRRELWKDFTLGIQYYGEQMEDYTAYRSTFPAAFPLAKKYRDMVTVSLKKLLKHQTLQLSLFAYYSPADQDYFIKPEMFYKLSDALSLTVGANLFGGEKETTFWGQYDKNDNVYSSLRFDF